MSDTPTMEHFPKGTVRMLNDGQDRLRADLERYIEDEAKCCPEDVGFPEYIASLQRALTTDRTALATLRAACRAVLDADDAVLASTNADAMAEASNDFDQTLTALRALTADHEEGR